MSMVLTSIQLGDRYWNNEQKNEKKMSMKVLKKHSCFSKLHFLIGPLRNYEYNIRSEKGLYFQFFFP